MQQPPFTVSSGSARPGGANPNEAKPTGTPDPTAKNPASSPKLEKLLAESAQLLAEPNHDMEALKTSYRTDFQPKGVHEEMLVRELALYGQSLPAIRRA
jgi:hypothetical protein